MTKVTKLRERWMEEPEYQTAYEELAPEFEVASSAIAARSQAGLSQEELAKRRTENNLSLQEG